MNRFTKSLIAIGLAFVVFGNFASSEDNAPTFSMVNVYDAFGENAEGLHQDFGFSAVIEYNGKLILFDAGTNAVVFQQNLAALDIDPRKIDVAIASHGHHDHIGGFDYLISVNPTVELYLPKDFFSLGAPLDMSLQGTEIGAYKKLPKDQRYFGGDKSIAEIRSTGRFWNANVTYVTEPVEIITGVTLIPTTSDLMGTFVKYPPFAHNPKFIGMPELSVSFTTNSGEALVAGCSHTGIEAIVEASSKVLDRDIHIVSGGFHLLPYDRPYIESLAQSLKESYGINKVAPAHCSGHLAFNIFNEIFLDDYISFGLGSRIAID